jgi:hypothetical protein
MAVNNRVINPALAQQLFRKREMLRRKRGGQPSAIEAFPRVIKTITALWRYAEGMKYLEELILVEEGRRRTGFPPEVQEEIIFLYEMLVDQRRILTLHERKHLVKRPPGTRFTMNSKL